MATTDTGSTRERADWIPTEKVHSARPLAIGLAWTLALLLVLFTNYLAGRLLRHTQANLGYWLIDSKWRLLSSLDAPVDTLILGDSSCNQGVAPRLVEQRLGGHALNLCTVGDLTAMNDAWMLQAYLERFGPPKRVIVVHVYDIWQRPLQKNMAMRIPIGYRAWSSLEPPIALTTRDRIDYLLHHYVPLYSQNLSLRDLVMKPWKHEGQRYRCDDRGYMAWPDSDPEKVHADTRSHRRFLERARFRLSESNRTALEHMMSLADAHEFPLYLATAPVHSELARLESFQAYLRRVNDALARISAPSRLTRRILVRPVLFPARQMVNVDHVVEEAAAVYTERLLDAVLEAEETGPGQHPRRGADAR